MRAILVLLATTAIAGADPRLVLEHAPAPRHLKMRTSQATPVKPPAPRPQLPASATPPAAPPPRELDELAGLRDVRENKVSVTVNLGYAVEAAPPSGLASLGGHAPTPQVDYARIRSYGFGEAFVSERGLAFQSISAYLSTRFEALSRLAANDTPLTAPISNWFDTSGKEIRTGWIEAKDFLPASWGLSKLRVRAGNEYVYGAWPMHVDTPAMIGWDGPIFSGTAFVGVRHPDYIRNFADADQPNQPTVSAATARFDLRGLHAPLPITIGVEGLSVGDTTDHAGHQTGLASTHTQVELDWRPLRDIALIGQVRWLDSKPANEHLVFRGRYKQVSNLVAELTLRQNTDWQWDPAVVLPQGDPMAPRRYLDLGPVLPQAILSVRAGTLIAENVDLYGRFAGATDTTDQTKLAKVGTNPSYVELGGSIEVRLRRTISVTASGTSRRITRPSAPSIIDERLVAQPLPEGDLVGELGFIEVGGGARMSLGARRFSAFVEIYGRRTRYTSLYADPLMKIPTSDVRGGGRFTLDAWIGKQVRLFASYDLSSAVDFAPEITGFKSLRLAISGVY